MEGSREVAERTEAVTISFALAWWHVGPLMMFIGFLLWVLTPEEHSSFGNMGIGHLVGGLLFISGILYLIFGFIARCFP